MLARKSTVTKLEADLQREHELRGKAESERDALREENSDLVQRAGKLTERHAFLKKHAALHNVTIAREALDLLRWSPWLHNGDPAAPVYTAQQVEQGESDEERAERLSTPGSLHEQALAEILDEVEAKKQSAGFDDDTRLSPEFAQEFVTKAAMGAAYAADKTVAAFAPRTRSVEETHRANFEAAFNGQAGDDQPSDFERAALEAEIAAPEGTDPVVGVDELGRDVCRDEDGTDYVLTDAA
jgi:hypothetical protein